MHIGLFVLGVATAVVGFAAIVYGIPVNEFSFGNTLIVSGTVAVVGGFLLIGLAAVVRQLKRLAESDHLHQASMPLSIHSADPVKPLPQPGLQASQFMPSPAPPRPDTSPRMPAPSEPATFSATRGRERTARMAASQREGAGPRRPNVDRGDRSIAVAENFTAAGIAATSAEGLRSVVRSAVANTSSRQ